VCSAKFYQKSRLKRHEAKHSDVKSYECLTCGEKFKAQWSLYKHKLKHLQESDQGYKCTYPECNRKFADKLRLKRHSITHTEAKQFECNFPSCKKKFSSLSVLYCHKKKHKANDGVNQEKIKLKCTECDKTFATKSVLKKHMLIHNPERPFSCDICSKGFRTKFQLAEHKLSHDEKMKRFECNLCNKK